MTKELHNYLIQENRFKLSFLDGFDPEGRNTLRCQSDKPRHIFVSNAVDGAERDAEWGRVSFTCEMADDMVYVGYALAVNEKDSVDYLFDPEVSPAEKRRFMEVNDAVKFVNCNDCLLYDTIGRYLFIMIDIVGYGDGSISNICINNMGDILMPTMPELYRERGSFFHRYLSVFSSIELDFQKKLLHIDDLLDPNIAPKELLPMYAHWMGIDVSGDFLKEDRLRTLVKEAYMLNKMKGTKEALERITEIILGEKAIVLEKNVIREHSQVQEGTNSDILYGDRPYDVTLLIRTYVPENEKSQLLFILNQFKPVRSRLLIHFLDGNGAVDRHSYMDMNATIQEFETGALDERQNTDGMILLGE